MPGISGLYKSYRALYCWRAFLSQGAVSLHHYENTAQNLCRGGLAVQAQRFGHVLYFKPICKTSRKSLLISLRDGSGHLAFECWIQVERLYYTSYN